MTIADTDIPFAAGPTPVRLKRRPDFLRAALGRKNHSALFTVQTIERDGLLPGSPRVGFTVTKKVGGAVERNRIKRRLREFVRVAPDLCMRPTHDYVIVARREVLTAPASVLATALKSAIRKLHSPQSPRRGRGPEGGRATDVGTSGS